MILPWLVLRCIKVILRGIVGFFLFGVYGGLKNKLFRG